MKNRKILIAGAVLLVLGILVVFGVYWKFYRNQAENEIIVNTETTIVEPEKILTEQPQPESKTVTPPVETKVDMYTDPAKLFSFDLHKNISVEQSVDKSYVKSDIVVIPTTYNLKTMKDLPAGYDKATLTSLRDDLKSGTVKSFIPGMLVKDTITLREYEICDIQFTRDFDFFDGNDILVNLKFVIPSSKIQTVTKNNTEYFYQDQENCGTQTVWKDSDTMLFLEAMEAGKTDSITQSWYKDSAENAKTFKFL